MSFLSLLTALILEQWYSVGWRNPVFRAFGRFAHILQRNLNAGEFRHGALGWLSATLPWLLLLLVVYHLAAEVSVILAWAVNVVVLYFTLGFRQFSSAFTTINEALNNGELDQARSALENWTRTPAAQLTAEEVARLAIEHGVQDAFRHVFAPMFWFTLLAAIGLGPTGALLYRMASMLDNRWGRRFRQYGEAFGEFSDRALYWLDWAPERLTAFSFAIMGNFEDAIYCWRQQARLWAESRHGALLATAAGAMGIKLGEALHRDHTVVYRPELGVGDSVDPQYLNSAVGLLWRTTVLWLLMILLLWLASEFSIVKA